MFNSNLHKDGMVFFGAFVPSKYHELPKYSSKAFLLFMPWQWFVHPMPRPRDKRGFCNSVYKERTYSSIVLNRNNLIH